MKGTLICILIGVFILFIAFTLETLKPVIIPIIVIGGIAGVIYLSATENKGKN